MSAWVQLSDKPVSEKCTNNTFYVWRMIWGLPKGLGYRIAPLFEGFLIE
jgi:hypothetical protein